MAFMASTEESEFFRRGKAHQAIDRELLTYDKDIQDLDKIIKVVKVVKVVFLIGFIVAGVSSGIVTGLLARGVIHLPIVGKVGVLVVGFGFSGILAATTVVLFVKGKIFRGEKAKKLDDKIAYMKKGLSEKEFQLGEEKRETKKAKEELRDKCDIIEMCKENKGESEKIIENLRKQNEELQMRLEKMIQEEEGLEETPTRGFGEKQFYQDTPQVEEITSKSTDDNFFSPDPQIQEITAKSPSPLQQGSGSPSGPSVARELKFDE